MKALPTLICLALCPAALGQSIFRTVTVADSDSGNATLPAGTHTSFSSPGSRAIAYVDFALPDAPGAEQVQLDYTAIIEGNIFIDLFGLASPHTDVDGSFNETTGVCDTFCNWGPSDSLQGFHPARVYGLALGELRTSILNSRAWGCNGRCSFSGTLTPADPSWVVMQASPNLMALREIRDVFFDARNGFNSTDVELRSFDVATYASVSVTNTFELSTIPLTQFCTSQQSSSGVPATIEAYGAPVDGSEWVTVRGDRPARQLLLGAVRRRPTGQSTRRHYHRLRRRQHPAQGRHPVGGHRQRRLRDRPDGSRRGPNHRPAGLLPRPESGHRSDQRVHVRRASPSLGSEPG